MPTGYLTTFLLNLTMFCWVYSIARLSVILGLVVQTGDITNKGRYKHQQNDRYKQTDPNCTYVLRKPRRKTTSQNHLHCCEADIASRPTPTLTLLGSLSSRDFPATCKRFQIGSVCNLTLIMSTVIVARRPHTSVVCPMSKI